MALLGKKSRRRSRGYALRAAIIPILLVGYPFLALGGPRNGHAEFYPFFMWNLFSRSIESSRADAVILVREIDSDRFESPKLFYDLGAYFPAARQGDARLAKLLDRLVRAERGGDSEQSAHLSQVIETTFMGGVPHVKYDIAVISYDPIRRYQTGEIDNITIVKSGEKNR